MSQCYDCCEYDLMLRVMDHKAMAVVKTAVGVSCYNSHRHRCCECSFLHMIIGFIMV